MLQRGVTAVMASARQPFAPMRVLLHFPTALTSLLLTDNFLGAQPHISDSGGATLAGHKNFPHEIKLKSFVLAPNVFKNWLLKIMASLLL